MHGRGLSVSTASDEQSTTTYTNSSVSENGCSPSPGTSVSNPHSDHGRTTSSNSSTPSNSPSSEEDDSARVCGWPQVAKAISETAEWEAFPRFKELNVMNLLYYQVELEMLQTKLRKAEDKDSKRVGSKQSQYARYADNMMRNWDKNNPKEHKQWALVLQIRSLLKEYNKALLRQAQISALPAPDCNNIDSLRKLLRFDKNRDYEIGRTGTRAWNLENVTDPSEKPLSQRILPLVFTLFSPRKTSSDLDLVATCPSSKQDGLTHWLSHELIPFYNDYWNKNTKHTKEACMNPIMKYPISTITRFTSACAMVFASVLPTLSIGLLTTAKGTVQKLCYIGGFTALLAIGLMFLSDASRVQIFTATSAFSAVLVVFLQNQ